MRERCSLDSLWTNKCASIFTNNLPQVIRVGWRMGSPGYHFPSPTPVQLSLITDHYECATTVGWITASNLRSILIDSTPFHPHQYQIKMGVSCPFC